MTTETTSLAQAPLTRCTWFEKPALLRDFHDHEWGEPVTDADILFEYVVLYGFGVGIGMNLVLQKREHFREELAGFDPDRLAHVGPARIDELLDNTRLIRNRRKMEAAVTNAKAWLRLRNELGGNRQLLAFFYTFVNGTPLDNQRPDGDPPPLSTPASEAMSQTLKKRGFALMGPATCYGLMQTAGLVNDHVVSCFRHGHCLDLARNLNRP